MRKHKREYIVVPAGLAPDIRCEALDARDAGKRALSEYPHIYIRLTTGEIYGGWPDRGVANRWNMNVDDAAVTDIYRSYVGGAEITTKYFTIIGGRVNWI